MGFQLPTSTGEFTGFLVAINNISGISIKNPETKGFFKNLDKKILGLSHALPRPVKESESNPCPHRLDKGINSPVEGKVVEIPHDLYTRF